MVFFQTIAGHGKQISEDTILIGSSVYSNTSGSADIPYGGLICIADGVGGNNAGEIASSFVLNALSGYEWKDDDTTIEKVLDINRNLISYSEKESRLNGMATTLSGVCFLNNELKILHVGNTRVYSMQGHYLKQLTSDHTTFNWLKSIGRLEEAELCKKNEITNCLGGGDEKLSQKFCVNTYSESSTLLLTSDGVHDYVSIDELEEVINSDLSNENKCDQIIKKAIEAGSDDDISVVLIYTK